MTFTVDHVSLEFQRIAEQDSIETACWYLFGTSTGHQY